MISLALLAVLLAVEPVEAERPPFGPDVALDDVYRGGGFVVASYPGGIAHADLDRRVWEPSLIPGAMPRSGRFARSPDGAGPIFYHGLWYERLKNPVRQLTSQIFVSRDQGRTWQRAGELPAVKEAFRHPDGTLYAITSRDGGNSFQGISVSRDDGETWAEAPSDGLFGNLMNLSVDPDHPSRICVTAHAFRGYFFQAADDAYSRWTSTSWFGGLEKMTPAQRLEYRGMSTSNGHVPLYQLQSTFGNYFGHDFGASTRISGVRVAAESPEYRFRRGDPMPVRVTIEMLIRGTTVRLPEVANADCWNVVVLTPAGTLDHVPSGRPNPYGNWKTVGKPLARHRPDLRTAEVLPGKPYRREFRLNELYEFRTPGTYRLRFDYDGDWIGDSNAGEWAARVDGEPFTLVVE